MFVNEKPMSPAPATAVEPAGERFKTLAVLERVLRESMRLGELHKNARWQISGSRLYKIRQTLNELYREQRSLIGLLVDRIHHLSGVHPEFGEDSMRCAGVCRAIRGPMALNRLLRDLLEAHEAVLRASRHDADDNRVVLRDFVIGQVVLTNEQQWERINGEVLWAGPQQRLIETDTSRLCERE